MMKKEAPSQKNVTIQDVANAAGVSKSTVSQFINKRFKYMSDDTKKKIEQTILELNYRPNDFARNLKTKKTKMIGIIVANIKHVFSTDIISAVEKKLSAQGLQAIICNSDDNPEKEKQFIELLTARQIDGLIIFPTNADVTLYEKILVDQIPLVLIDRKLEGLKADTVILDNETALYLAVSHLLEKKRKRIAMMTLPVEQHITPRIERIEGFYSAMKRSQQEVISDFVFSGTLLDIQTRLAEWLSNKQMPDAIIAGNDLVLETVLTFVKNHNLSIPNDLSILSIDDVPYAKVYNPTLTTVAQPTQQMGEMAATILLERLNNSGTPEGSLPLLYRFPPTLMDRESC